MNAVEIEEAISALAEQPFAGGEFPFAFLQAFGNKETTIKRLRAGASNKSDLGGVLRGMKKESLRSAAQFLRRSVSAPVAPTHIVRRSSSACGASRSLPCAFMPTMLTVSSS